MFKHKKTAAFVMSLLICMSAASASAFSAFAEGETTEAVSEEVTEASEETVSEESEYLVSGDYEYSVTDSGEICIEGYNGSEKNITVPDTIDGKNVTELGADAFFESTAETIHIPAGITYIADNPFLESYFLSEITVAEDNADYYAEDGVLYLKRNESGATLLCYPQGKDDLTFTVPEDVTNIGAAAIYSTQLTEITLPAGLEYIYHHGLSYNERLSVIDMSGCTAMTEISDMAFAYCSAAGTVLLPPSVQYIGGASFAGCGALTSIELPDTLVSIGQNAFAATGLKKVQIPSSVTEIGYSAFGYDENLEPIDSFTIIGATGSAAQTYCTDTDEEYGYANNFTFVDESNAELVDEAGQMETKTSGDYMYAEKDGGIYILMCSSVDSKIEIPAEFDGLPVTCIYGAAFYQNQASEIVIPDTVTRIGDIAFSECTNLKTINLPASLTEINNQAFAGCTSLEKITIPAGVETIGEEAFYGCTSLKEFAVDGTSEYFTVDDGVLCNAEKTIIVSYPAAKKDSSYKAPDTANEILISAFAGASNLETVDISSVVTIGSYAFEQCEKLSSVKLSEELDSIGTCAFYNCPELKAMRTYNNVTQVGTAAIGFYYDEENDTDAVVDGFVLYAPENSGGARYASSSGIECEYDVSKYTEKSVADTVRIFGFKFEKTFLYVAAGILLALIAAAAGLFISKSSKKKKEEAKLKQIKADAVKKLEERKNEDAEKSSEDEKTEAPAEEKTESSEEESGKDDENGKAE
ncbi:MAG: leucine-rich repeat protein [Ruminococcus sp.]|nr:leucine-rich repeat protein [Ruminococcus sp.]